MAPHKVPSIINSAAQLYSTTTSLWCVNNLHNIKDSVTFNNLNLKTYNSSSSTKNQTVSRMTYFKVLTVVVVLLGIWQLSSDAFMIKPFKLNSLHASCHVNWTFGINCSDVQNKLVNQVNKWSGRTYCPDNKGEKCLYEIVKKNMTNLDTKHTTPSKGYVDDQFFAFYQNSSGICLTTGYSTSETFYAVLDKGTNYCDLHNLITGSGLDKVPKYTETTNDNICTQYSSADCDVY